MVEAKSECSRCRKAVKTKWESIPQHVAHTLGDRDSAGEGSYQAELCSACATELRLAQKG